MSVRESRAVFVGESRLVPVIPCKASCTRLPGRAVASATIGASRAHVGSCDDCTSGPPLCSPIHPLQNATHRVPCRFFIAELHPRVSQSRSTRCSSLIVVGQILLLLAQHQPIYKIQTLPSDPAPRNFEVTPHQMGLCMQDAAAKAHLSQLHIQSTPIFLTPRPHQCTNDAAQLLFRLVPSKCMASHFLRESMESFFFSPPLLSLSLFANHTMGPGRGIGELSGAAAHALESCHRELQLLQLFALAWEDSPHLPALPAPLFSRPVPTPLGHPSSA